MPTNFVPESPHTLPGFAVVVVACYFHRRAFTSVRNASPKHDTGFNARVWITAIPKAGRSIPFIIFSPHIHFGVFSQQTWVLPDKITFLKQWEHLDATKIYTMHVWLLCLPWKWPFFPHAIQSFEFDSSFIQQFEQLFFTSAFSFVSVPRPVCLLLWFFLKAFLMSFQKRWNDNSASLEYFSFFSDNSVHLLSAFRSVFSQVLSNAADLRQMRKGR